MKLIPITAEAFAARSNAIANYTEKKGRYTSNLDLFTHILFGHELCISFLNICITNKYT